MTYVLIMLFFFRTNAPAMSSVTAEFNSLEACLQAARSMSSDAKERSLADKVSYGCYEKGKRQ